MRGRPANGKHWTQTPAGKRRMKAIHKKAWETRHTKAIEATDEEFDDDLKPIRMKAREPRRVTSRWVESEINSTDSFEKQMVQWNGWEVLAEDKEQNCLIVKVPLGGN